MLAHEKTKFGCYDDRMGKGIKFWNCILELLITMVHSFI